MKISKLMRKIFHCKKSKKEPDVYIISYPKSGRTWVRFMLCSYLAEKYSLTEDVRLDLMAATEKAGLPLTNFSHDQTYMSWGLSFSEMKFNHQKFSGKKVVFLGRDLKDTVVSAYHQATKRNIVFDGPISGFIQDERYGVRKIAGFYKMWLENRSVPATFSCLSYEDFHQTPVEALTAVLRCMGEEPIDETLVRSAVDQGRFDNMRKVELSESAKTSVLTPGDSSDPNSFKTRKGVVGSYSEELSEADIRYIDEITVQFGIPGLMDECRDSFLC